jgi:preprotein translocase subunit SecF
MPMGELVNLSVNQSLTRSINTSIAATTTMLIVTIVCIASGVTSILSLSVPLFIGMLIGAYSSICVAPALFVLKEKKSSLDKKSTAEA